MVATLLCTPFLAPSRRIVVKLRFLVQSTHVGRNFSVHISTLSYAELDSKGGRIGREIDIAVPCASRLTSFREKKYASNMPYPCVRRGLAGLLLAGLFVSGAPA